MYTGLPRSCKNPNVNVIGHSGSEYFKYDYEKVIPQLAKEGKLIEINDSAFRYKKSCASNCTQIAKLCKNTKQEFAWIPIRTIPIPLAEAPKL